MSYTTWDDLTILQREAITYSDLYKEAYGYRPRGMNFDSWTEEDFSREFDILAGIVEFYEAERKVIEATAIQQFEDSITNLMHPGTNRARIVAWLMLRAGAEGNEDYFCYLTRLPYNYPING